MKQGMGGHSRRGFLVRACAVVAGMLLGGYVRPPARAVWAARENGSTIAVIKGNDLSAAVINRMVDEGFEALGGVGRFIKPDMNVVIKPNIGWNSPPERAHNTNPDLVEAVARLCIAQGARVKIFDRSVNTPQLCYRRSGIAQAAKNAGADISYMDDNKYFKLAVPSGLVYKSLPVYGDIMDADFLINMPIAKHHGSSTLTLSMKNLMGVLGGERGLYHWDLHPAIVDFNKAVKSDLVILDATRILTAHGPNGGEAADIRETKTIVMGTNPVTVDAWAVTLFGMQPGAIGYLALAGREGMGEINPAAMNVISRSV
ncbi:MAG: DUF362 domain-containing protein [Spirochaetes bacterium]|nr:MAG: DUF362 domain-containing protein [Spirochaetota bacterium]